MSWGELGDGRADRRFDASTDTSSHLQRCGPPPPVRLMHVTLSSACRNSRACAGEQKSKGHEVRRERGGVIVARSQWAARTWTEALWTMGSGAIAEQVHATKLCICRCFDGYLVMGATQGQASPAAR